MWDQFSPENAGKWGSVQGSSQSTFNWSSLDAMYKYCQDNNIIFKEHNFIWGAQQPSWVTSSNAPAAVQTWMTAFCERYPNIAVIDVVNEALHNTPALHCRPRRHGHQRLRLDRQCLQVGEGGVPERRPCCTTTTTPSSTQAKTATSSSWSMPIKGAGAPDRRRWAARATTWPRSRQARVTTYVQNIISQTGLPVYITEMDIGIADDTQQSTIMKDVVTPFWANDNVKGYHLLGLHRRSHLESQHRAHDRRGTKRPALTWLMSFLGR